MSKLLGYPLALSVKFASRTQHGTEGCLCINPFNLKIIIHPCVKATVEKEGNKEQLILFIRERALVSTNSTIYHVFYLINKQASEF